MASGRSLAGNIAAIFLAAVGLLGYLPWLITAVLIIAVAIIAILPSSKSRILPESGSSGSASTLVIQQQQQHHGEPHSLSHAQNRPIQRLPQAIIEALRPAPKPDPEEDKQILDTGRPVERVIPAGDYESLEYGIHEGEELSVEVNGDGPLNVYLLTEDNLNSLDSDQEFWFEAGNEGMRNSILRFSPEESGTWFLVVENTGEKDVKATLKVQVRQPTHPVPLLKPEKLELPDQKPERKLSL